MFSAFRHHPRYTAFSYNAWWDIAHCLPYTVLLLFLLARDGESRRSMGWQFRWQGLGLGLVLCIPCELARGLLNRGFTAAGLPYTQIWAAGVRWWPVGGAEMTLCVGMAAAVAVWEESFSRGYLLLRLKGIGASPGVALLASSLLFGLGHAYQGPLGVAVNSVTGLLWGLLYLWRRNLTAPVVLHFVSLLTYFLVWPAVNRGMPS